MNETDQLERVDLFWHYVSERRAVELRRRAGDPPPWTDDPVLRRYRFTDVYRASDRVSQYLIRHVQYAPDADPGPGPSVFRTLLFRIFNLPDTYARLREALGGHPDLRNWDPERYARVLDEYRADGRRLWNGAYMMTGRKGEDKHRTFLGILDRMVRDGMTLRIRLARDKPDCVYEILHGYPLISDFLAMQYTTDLGYLPFTTWEEDDFIVPGHGARRGAYKLFGAADPVAVIRVLREHQHREPRRFPSLGGVRPLSLMDVQNCLCEYDKYTRVARPAWRTPYDRSARPLPKQSYRAEEATELPAPFFPPKWRIPKGGR